MNKAYVHRQPLKPTTPYRVKCGRYTVSVHTESEAKRVKKFINKVLKAGGDI